MVPQASDNNHEEEEKRRRGDGGLIPGRWFHLGHVQSERVGGEVLRLAKVAEAAYPEAMGTIAVSYVSVLILRRIFW
jgi:hypothetical protein